MKLKVLIAVLLLFFGFTSLQINSFKEEDWAFFRTKVLAGLEVVAIEGGAQKYKYSFQGFDLSGVSFPEAFKELNFGQIGIENVVYLDLRGVNFSGGDFTGSDLSNVDLSNANLSNAVLNGTILFNTKLLGTDLTGAKIESLNNTQGLMINADTKVSEENKARLFQSGTFMVEEKAPEK